MIVGSVLVAQAVIIGIFALASGAIQGGEIVSLVYAYLIGGAAFFGINIGRITAENIADKTTPAETTELSIKKETMPPVAVLPDEPVLGDK